MVRPNPATNLLLADIVLSGTAKLLRARLGERTAAAALEGDDRQDAEDSGYGESTPLAQQSGRAIITTLGLYGAGKLANRSAAGLILVAGGLAAKTLHDRGKAVRKRASKRK